MSPLAALVTASVLATVFLAPGAAHAYVGPGAGFALVGSFLTAFAALLAGLLSLLTFPVRFAVRSFRRRKALARARVRRVIVLGLDGLDPNLVERWIATGDLPNLERLAEQGSFSRLRTTYPSISPVAWSSFMTGVDPARHNIFDFLNRDLRTYKPDLSSVRISGAPRSVRIGPWVLPVGKPVIRNLRRSKAFWTVLGEHRIPSNVLRVPLTFPPEKFAGVLLSAMCVPDLKGTQGSFAFYSTDPEKVNVDPSLSVESTGGERHLMRLEDGAIEARLRGPDAPRGGDQPLELPFRLEVDRAKNEVRLRIQGKKLTLQPRVYSPWVELRFRASPTTRVHGIARFYVTELGEHVGLYVTPLNIDPGRPALPISFPGYYSVYLSRLIGQFATLGLAEDTWALNERVIDEEAFLQQTLELHAEREAMFLNAIEKSREGLVACVFDGTDRLQHMFFRYLEPDHPANAGKDTTRFKDAILDMYRRADALVGRTLEKLGKDDHLIVLSDHGFQAFRRGVNLNTWLREQGLLALEPGREQAGEWFEGVDWSRTQAYAFGLGGIYLNVAGREAHGIVQPGDEAQATKEKIIQGLSGLRDAAEVAINEVFDNQVVHPSGPYRDNGPDLIVGYNRGYRASWEGAVGRTSAVVVTDNTRSWSGDHCVDPRLVPGVLFSSRAIRDTDPAITDLAPTILAQFGIEKPAYMTGRILAVQ